MLISARAAQIIFLASGTEEAVFLPGCRMHIPEVQGRLKIPWRMAWTVVSWWQITYLITDMQEGNTINQQNATPQQYMNRSNFLYLRI